MHQLRSSVCVARISLGLMINVGVLYSSSRITLGFTENLERLGLMINVGVLSGSSRITLGFTVIAQGFTVIALGFTEKSLCTIK